MIYHFDYVYDFNFNKIKRFYLMLKFKIFNKYNKLNKTYIL